MTTRSKILSTLLLLTAAAIIAVLVLPWKPWVETRLKAYLEAQGFQDVQLTVSSIGPGGISLRDISVGSTKPLHLGQLTLGFSLPALLGGGLHDVDVSGLSLDLTKEGESWAISGMQSQPPASASAARTTIPVTRAALAALPFDSIRLLDSSLHIASGKAWQMDVPVLTLAGRKAPVAEMSYETRDIHLKAQNIKVSTGPGTLKARLDENTKKWIGEWHIYDVKMTGISPDVPLLVGNGTIAAGDEDIMVKGQFASADQSYKSNFHLDYFLNEPDKSRLQIIETVLPWNGGVISAANVAVPLNEKRAVNVELKVQRVSLASLLQQLTGKPMPASTGAISGSLPVSINTNGTISVQQGKLQAEEPGIIAMPPETIPGDNEQVALARDVLKNLHYTLLSIDVDQDKDNKLSVLMKVEGANPDVSQGRAVKLNVHLTGDVLNFVQQNLMMLTNPEQLLRQGPDAKP